MVELKFACRLCKFKNKSEHDREKHMVSAHRGKVSQEMLYSCYYCQTEFIAEEDLQKHKCKGSYFNILEGKNILLILRP